jgi:hypothetical protein
MKGRIWWWCLNRNKPKVEILAVPKDWTNTTIQQFFETIRPLYEKQGWSVALYRAPTDRVERMKRRWF